MSLHYHGSDVALALQQEYAVPAKMGILRTFKSPMAQLTALSIIKRIMVAREQYQKRYEKKSKAEEDYVAKKEYVQEN